MFRLCPRPLPHPFQVFAAKGTPPTELPCPVDATSKKGRDGGWGHPCPTSPRSMRTHPPSSHRVLSTSARPRPIFLFLFFSRPPPVPEDLPERWASRAGREGREHAGPHRYWRASEPMLSSRSRWRSASVACVLCPVPTRLHHTCSFCGDFTPTVTIMRGQIMAARPSDIDGPSAAAAAQHDDDSLCSTSFCTVQSLHGTALVRQSRFYLCRGLSKVCA
jgi:hypothetical protein